MADALGMIETKGFVGMVEAADAMVKAAQGRARRLREDRRRLRHRHRARRRRGGQGGDRSRAARGRARRRGGLGARDSAPARQHRSRCCRSAASRRRRAKRRRRRQVASNGSADGPRQGHRHGGRDPQGGRARGAQAPRRARLRRRRQADRRSVVAVDAVGAGIGEVVLYARARRRGRPRSPRTGRSTRRSWRSSTRSRSTATPRYSEGSRAGEPYMQTLDEKRIQEIVEKVMARLGGADLPATPLEAIDRAVVEAQPRRAGLRAAAARRDARTRTCASRAARRGVFADVDSAAKAARKAFEQNERTPIESAQQDGRGDARGDARRTCASSPSTPSTRPGSAASRTSSRRTRSSRRRRRAPRSCGRSPTPATTA